MRSSASSTTIVTYNLIVYNLSSDLALCDFLLYNGSNGIALYFSEKTITAAKRFTPGLHQ